MLSPLLMMAAESTAAGAPEKPDTASYLLNHVQDSHEWTLPSSTSLSHAYDLHEWLGHWVVTIPQSIPKFGGQEIDLTPTRFALIMMGATVLLMGGLLWSMRGRGQSPKGRLQTLVEIFFVFVRDEIAEKNIGHGYERYVPYLATVFFFIMTCNLIGLVPYLSTPTGNLAVTGTLAILTFIVTQVAGMRAKGVVGYWMHLVPDGVPWLLYPLFIPIEIVGLFTKPFALMMRLFANMVAGHIVIYFLIGLIFFFGTLAVAPVSVGFALAIYFLEIFVALLQAYIFTILSAVFIGLAGSAH